MTKISMIIATLFIMVASNVQAEFMTGGTVNKIDIKAGLISIDHVQYQIQPSKTKLMSGEHQLNLSLLKEGKQVDFVTQSSLITDIRLVIPYVFNH